MSKEDSSRLSLKVLAPETARIVREYGTATTEEIATVVITKFQGSIDNSKTTTQDTIRRRIYDVINVLAASGLIEKVGKKITWNSTTPYLQALPSGDSSLNQITTNEDKIIESRIKEKEAQLRAKICLLTLYKALTERNFPKSASEKDISLPTILICLENSNDIAFSPSDPDNKRIEIRATKQIKLQSPLEILKNINFDKNVIAKLLQAQPADFSQYATDLLSE